MPVLLLDCISHHRCGCLYHVTRLSKRKGPIRRTTQTFSSVCWSLLNFQSRVFEMFCLCSIAIIVLSETLSVLTRNMSLGNKNAHVVWVLNPLKPSGYYMYHEKFYVLPTQRISVFSVDLRTAIISLYSFYNRHAVSTAPYELGLLCNVDPFKAQWLLYVPPV